jgi:short subunit dehydrogenase-like uncharacterized protein
MERVEFKYAEAARDAGVHVVSSCGFDSIPADWGVVLAMQQFQPPAVSELFGEGAQGRPTLTKWFVWALDSLA